jgi:TPR repeat protein
MAGRFPAPVPSEEDRSGVISPDEAALELQRHKAAAARTDQPEAALAAAVAATRLLQRGPIAMAPERRELETRAWAETSRTLAVGLAERRFKFWGDSPRDPVLVAALAPVVEGLPALAAAGDADAQFELAYFLGEGLVCPRNPAREDAWLARAEATHLAASFRRVWTRPGGYDSVAALLAAYEPCLARAEAAPPALRPGPVGDPLAPRWREARDRWRATYVPPPPPPPERQPLDGSCIVEDPSTYWVEREDEELARALAGPPPSTLFWAVEEAPDEPEGGLAIFFDGQAVNRAARALEPDRPAIEAPPVPPMLTLASPRSYPGGVEPPIVVYFEGCPVGRLPEGPPGPATHEARLPLLAALAEDAPAWAGTARAFLAGRGVGAVEAIAACSGDAAACVRVALAFARGEGVAPDFQAAYVWLSLAAAAGSGQAWRWLDLAPPHDERALLDGIALAWWSAATRAPR